MIWEMYGRKDKGCGTLVWYQRKCNDFEEIQNGFGIYLWEVGKVRNELVRVESGWSSFPERKRNAWWIVCLE